MEKTSKLPTFLGIGAQRSGSTWLYKNLKQHPQIWLTPIKEIHFFDKPEGLKLTDKQYRRDALRRIRENLIKVTKFSPPTYRDFQWDLHYFFKKRDLNWYKSIFRPNPRQIAGEVTPAYAVLDKEIVMEIYKLNPNLKIIFLMRDPIERAWSAVIRGLAREKRRRADEIPAEAILKKLYSNSFTMRGNYVRTLELWENIFRPEQIHIDFLDEIEQNPRGVLLRIYRFLEISDDEKYIPVSVEEKKNSTDGYKIPIPPEIQLQLARTHLQHLETLHQRFGGHTTNWLKRAQSIIDSIEISKESAY